MTDDLFADVADLLPPKPRRLALLEYLRDDRPDHEYCRACENFLGIDVPRLDRLNGELASLRFRHNGQNADPISILRSLRILERDARAMRATDLILVALRDVTGRETANPDRQQEHRFWRRLRLAWEAYLRDETRRAEATARRYRAALKED